MGRFLDAGVPVNQLNGGRLSLLHLAVENGAPLHVVQILIDRGIDIGLYDLKGQRALHRAAARDRPDLISLLLAHGADPNVADHAGLPPIRYAQSEEVGQALLAAGADANAQDIQGRTVLSWLLEDMLGDKPLPPIVQLLLDAGADLDLADFTGRFSARELTDNFLSQPNRDEINRFVAARNARKAVRGVMCAARSKPGA